MNFIPHKIEEWSHYVEALSNIAISQPQATYITLTKSLQQKWEFFTPGCCSHFFECIENLLFTCFLSPLMGHDSTSEERLL